MTMHHSTILGIDPGTRYLGAAVVRGQQLLEYGVHELRNGSRPYDVIGHARGVVFRYVAKHQPIAVAIEAPYKIATERGALLSVLAQELHGRAKELGLTVTAISPETVRERVTGNRRSTKYEVAQWLTLHGFAELRDLVPKKPRTPALWLSSRDRYWLHMFDALALSVAAAQRGEQSIMPD